MGLLGGLIYRFHARRYYQNMLNFPHNNFLKCEILENVIYNNLHVVPYGGNLRNVLVVPRILLGELTNLYLFLCKLGKDLKTYPLRNGQNKELWLRFHLSQQNHFERGNLIRLLYETCKLRTKLTKV